MINRTTVALLVLCLGAGFAAYEQWHASPPKVPEAPVGGAGAGAAEWEPLTPPPQPPLGSYEEIVARPLFMRDRRPPEPDQTPTVTQQVRQQPTLKLEGTVVAPERNVALLRDLRTNEVNRAGAGQTVQGWQVVDVGQGWVDLETQGQTLRLHMEQPVPEAAGGAARPSGPGSRRIRGGGR